MARLLLVVGIGVFLPDRYTLPSVSSLSERLEVSELLDIVLPGMAGRRPPKDER